MPDFDDAIVIDGQRRRYACHVPAGLPAGPSPLLLALHGRRITGADMRRWTRFDVLADRRGFVVAYPEGYRRSWNDGRGASPAAHAGVDDVGFLRALVERLIERAGVDPARVAAAGLSNGGVMGQRLALELGERIAVVASVAGTMPAGLADLTPSYAVSVLLIHGTADRYAPSDGGPPRGVVARATARLLRGRSRSGAMLSVAATAARWRAIDQCRGGSARDWLPAAGKDPTRVERARSGGGRGGAAVECWIVHGGGHTWPGGPRLLGLGRTSARFDASEVIWDFASRHFAPAAERRLGDGAAC